MSNLPERLKRLAAFDERVQSRTYFEVVLAAQKAGLTYNTHGESFMHGFRTRDSQLQPLIEALIDECVKTLEIYADPDEWTINAIENGFNRHGYDKAAREALTALEKLSGDI